MKLTDEEYETIHRFVTGKTRWEEAVDSTAMLGCAILTVLVLIVVGFIIIIEG